MDTNALHRRNHSARELRHDRLRPVARAELARWIAVWRRNQLVACKLAIASILGNIADRSCTCVALGFGIGAFIPEVDGMKYIAFLGTGMVCQSAMFTSSFEAMYSAFSRMHVQRTWTRSSTRRSRSTT